MIDERMEELGTLYALGAMTPQEAAQFETELRQNPELQVFVASMQNVTDGLSTLAPLVAPPAALKSRILAAVDSGAKIVPLPATEEAAPASTWFPWAIAACLAAICVVLGINNSLYRQRLADQMFANFTLQSTTNELSQTVAALKESNRLADFRIALLSSQIADQPKATAVSLWNDKDQSGLFVVENLKAPAPDQDYQLWVIDPQYKIPVDAGVFKVDAAGKVRFPFKATQHIATTGLKIAVTAEQKGGSPTPKGKLVLLGE